MKLLSKVKKGLIGIGLFLLTFPKKIFATSVQNIIEGGKQYLYGPPTEALYGVYDPSPTSIIWTIAKIFVIPVALVIGLIIYFKKSKSPTKKKVLIAILSIAIIVAVYIVGNIYF